MQDDRWGSRVRGSCETYVAGGGLQVETDKPYHGSMTDEEETIFGSWIEYLEG